MDSLENPLQSLDLDTIDDCNKEMYEKSHKYWSLVKPGVQGMLGGFAHLSATDINSSRDFISFLRKKDFQSGNDCALDCGSGIGRVTKSLLLPIFNSVDMVDSIQHFLEQSKVFIGEKNWHKIDRCFAESLNTFKPPLNRYNLIWIQWVIGYLSDLDFIEFLRNCQKSLRVKGCIVVKDNVTVSSERDFDDTDSSVTRNRAQLVEIFTKSGLQIVSERRQLHFPKGMYEVRMFALKPDTILSDEVLMN